MMRILTAITSFYNPVIREDALVYKRVVTGEESTHQNPGTLTEQQAERILAGINESIRAGEEMRKLRAEMIKVFVGLGWTQERIARLAGMSQPAVSKQISKYRTDNPPQSPMGLSLDQHDTPWLEGRLWGLAERISETFHDTASCTRYVHALTRGKKRFTPQNIDELRRLVEEDLRLHRAELPASYQAAYDGISRGLDLPSKVTPITASASVRRSISHQIQRDLLRGDLT